MKVNSSATSSSTCQDNGGGYLQAAVELANEFLSPGDLIVYTESRSLPRQGIPRPLRNGRLRNGVHVTVLINEYTASQQRLLQEPCKTTTVQKLSAGAPLVKDWYNAP